MRKMLFKLAIAAVATLTPGLATAGEAEDEQVANEIAVNLKESGRLRHYQIGVAYREGTAWLSGNVTSAEQLVSALEIAQQTEGVSQVVNRLSVGGSAARTGTENPSLSNKLRSSLATLRSQDITPQPPSTPRQGAGIQRTSMEERVAPQSTWPVRQTRASADTLPTRQNPVRQSAPQGRQAAPMAYARTARAMQEPGFAPAPNTPLPSNAPGVTGMAPAQYDHAHMPSYAWPSYAAYPNYAAVTYPRQYSPTAWPYIGPFYPYPQVPLGWRKVVLQWDDGWWQLDFKEK